MFPLLGVVKCWKNYNNHVPAGHLVGNINSLMTYPAFQPNIS